jgi:hypothetical protein
MRNETYDLVSIFFVALSAFVCIISLMIMGGIVQAGPFQPETPTETPTEVALGTFTPTPTQPTATLPAPTPLPSPTPSFTPFPTETPSDTPVPTVTLTPSRTLSPTPPGNAIGTPLPTITPSPSPTETATDVPPEFPLVVQAGTPLFRNAFLYEGCEWQGIAGQVTLEDGVPATGLVVRVTGPGDPGSGESVTGSAPSYATAGYEVQVAQGALPLDYQVQVFDETGTTPLSAVITVTFSGDCEANLALVNFVQVAPF